MKKSKKIVTFGAALAATALALTACTNKTKQADPENGQTVDPANSTFDPSDNKNEDVYGPPEYFQ